MDAKYNILFKKLGFKYKRNEVLAAFVNKIENYIQQKKYVGLPDQRSKLKKYIKDDKASAIQIKDFIFKKNIDCCLFYHKDYPVYKYEFNNLKKFEIYEDEQLNKCTEEWIFCESYLRYIIYKVYNLKMPKFGNTLQSIQNDENTYSIDINNLHKLMLNDSHIIYEPKNYIIFDDLANIKQLDITEKLKNDFFLDIIGLKKNEKISSLNSLSFNELFESYVQLENKNMIFHNKDKYFRLNIIKNLDSHYNWGDLGYFFIDFQLFRNCNRETRLKRFIYLILSLFPPKYDYLPEFYYKELKNLLTKEFDCWALILDKIINYFEHKIFKKEDKIKQSPKESEKIDQINLFNNIEDKKFIIIFNNITNEKENNFIEKIIKKYRDSKFKFVICYPLVNEFTFNKFIKAIFSPYDTYFPFKIYFNNLLEKEDKDIQLIKESNNLSDIEYANSNEESIYDLIRIFNFKQLFTNEENYKSLLFLKKYIKHLNIKFDNKNKKIEDIFFKDKIMEKIFYNKYQNILENINSKNNLKFDNISEQPDGLGLEKIIISTIIDKKTTNFEILKLKSIFGLRELEQKNDFNYESSNFFLKQTSLDAEMFDFGYKFQKQNKNYLKLTQITSDKNLDELEKISIDRLVVQCSYLKKEFKEKKLGELNGISFSIIAPSRIVTNERTYKLFLNFCKINKYELILFDLNDKIFYKIENNIKENYDNKLFEINNEFLLDIPEFEAIITSDKDLRVLSTREVKDIDEDIEDYNAKIMAEDYINNKDIRRVGKFQFKGFFSDIKKLQTNYFAYIYYKKEIAALFYDNKYLGEIRTFNTDENKDKARQLTLILYSKEIINHNYKTSEENEDKNKIENLNEKNNKLIMTDESIDLDEDNFEKKKEKKRNIEIIINKEKDKDKKNIIKTGLKRERKSASDKD